MVDYKIYNGVPTFNLNKFIVVGSPNITDDGITSGFSGNNYLKINSAIRSSNWAIKASIIPVENIANDRAQTICSEVDSEQTVLFNFRILKNGKDVELNIQNVISATWPNALVLEKPQEVELIYKDKTLYLEINGILNPKTVPVDLDTFTTTNPLWIGYNSWKSLQVFYGSIDLKQFSIEVDGNKVFKGYYLIPEGMTVVGTPTITDDGIASGFSGYPSSTSCVKTSSIDLNKPCKIICKVKTGDTIGGTFFGQGGNNQAGLQLTFRNANEVIYYLKANDGTILIPESYTRVLQTIQPNTNYIGVYEWTGTGHFYSIYTENKTKVFEKNIDSTLAPHSGTIGIGATVTDQAYYRFNGSIDLKQFSITVDGVEVLSGSRNGTLVEKLLYLNDTKQIIKQAIVDKGVEITPDTPFREYADKIGEISSGGTKVVKNVTFFPMEYDEVNHTITNVTEESFPKVNKTFDISGDWEIGMKVKTPSQLEECHLAGLRKADNGNTGDRFGEYIYYTSNGSIGFDLSNASGTGWLQGDIMSSAGTVRANTEYWLKLSYYNYVYKLEYKSNSDDPWVTASSYTSTSKVYPNPKVLYLGVYRYSDYQKAFKNGIIYLEDCYIKNNGVKIWEGTKES